MKHWYAVHCKPRQDARAAEHLANQAYTVFRPLARVRRLVGDRVRFAIESLFPRYLFIQLDDETGDWSPIRSTRGVTGLVRLGGPGPTVVPDSLVADLRMRMDDHGIVDLVVAERFEEGEPVRVVSGAFAGCEAVFRARSASERVIVLLNLLGGGRCVELPTAAIAKV